MQAYGAQAVVVSIDPRRVYVTDPASTQRPTIKTEHAGPNGEQYCWCAEHHCTECLLGCINSCMTAALRIAHL